MRHTFATHLVRAGVGLVTIRDLLGHRQITSTQIYLHVTAEDLRAAAARHPIGALLGNRRASVSGGTVAISEIAAARRQWVELRRTTRSRTRRSDRCAIGRRLTVGPRD